MKEGTVDPLNSLKHYSNTTSGKSAGNHLWPSFPHAGTRLGSLTMLPAPAPPTSSPHPRPKWTWAILLEVASCPDQRHHFETVQKSSPRPGHRADLT